MNTQISYIVYLESPMMLFFVHIVQYIFSACYPIDNLYHSGLFCTYWYISFAKSIQLLLLIVDDTIIMYMYTWSCDKVVSQILS